MARTPEQVLREVVSGQIFQIAQLVSENENLKEEIEKLKANLKEISDKFEVLVSQIGEKDMKKDGTE